MTPGGAQERRYRVFAVLAAAALLFRWEPGIFLFVSRDGNVTWSGWLPVAAAFAVLFRPGDPRLLVAMYAGVAVDAWVTAPTIPNHYLLTLCVGAAIAATAAQLAVRSRRFPTGGELVAGFGAPLRVATAAFYLFTGFWKANDGFVDPEFSCGVASWTRLGAQFPFLPDGPLVRRLVIGGTLLLECGGPVLLSIPVARAAAGAVFLAFHVVLALDIVQNFQNFSWAMAPLLSLFLPDDAWDRAAERFPWVDRAGRFARIQLLAVHALLLVVCWNSSLDVPTFTVEPFTVARWFVSVVTLLSWAAGFAAAAAAFRELRGSGPAPRAVPAAWLGLALVVTNGVSPVIGFKNRNAWQMYSNVRIEADASNHWLLPASLDLFGLQRDLVTVVDANDLELLRTTRDLGLELTYWDLRVWLADHPTTRVTFRRGGRTWNASGTGPDAPSPPHPWLRKVVWFRPVGEQVARQCVW